MTHTIYLDTATNQHFYKDSGRLFSVNARETSRSVSTLVEGGELITNCRVIDHRWFVHEIITEPELRASKALA